MFVVRAQGLAFAYAEATRQAEDFVSTRSDILRKGRVLLLRLQQRLTMPY
jgi:hypothetical protein